MRPVCLLMLYVQDISQFYFEAKPDRNFLVLCLDQAHVYRGWMHRTPHTVPRTVPRRPACHATYGSTPLGMEVWACTRPVGLHGCWWQGLARKPLDL
jgi:hypothetical protein